MKMIVTLVSVLFLTLFSQTAGQAVIDSTTILHSMNIAREKANIQQLKWDLELSALAQTHADGCTLSESSPRVIKSYETIEIGENINVTANVSDPGKYIQDVIDYWRSLEDSYNDSTNQCTNSQDCILYTQLVWARTSQVGCGVSVCTSNSTEYHFFVCNFYPRGNRFGQHPLEKEEASTHFIVQLLAGQLLCFSVRGGAGSKFNLISTGNVDVNAQFITLSEYPGKNWLGIIGVTTAKKKLIFNSTGRHVQIDDKTILQVTMVKKIRIASGRFHLTMTDDPSNSQIEVEIKEPEVSLSFTTVFTGREHLDMLWLRGDVELKTIHGLLGQFLRPGVKVDEDKELIIFPGREKPQPMRQTKLVNFLHSDYPQFFKKEQLCWTTKNPSHPLVGLIEGSYLDYKVEDVAFNGFNFLG